FRENGAQKSSANRKIGRDGGGLNTGRGFGALDCGAKILLRAALFVVQRSQIESEHEKIIGLKAGIDVLRVLHAANEQACSDKRERNFRYDQEAAEGVSGPADGAAAAADFEHFDEVWFCGFDGRSDANEHSRKKGHAQGKEKHMGIEAQINVAIQDERRAER